MLDEYDINATFFVVADVVEHYPGLVESIVSVNSLYNKTDSSLEGVSSYPYYPKKNGLEIGEDFFFVEFPWRIGTFLDLILRYRHLGVQC